MAHNGEMFTFFILIKTIDGVMTTSDYNAADGCNIVYSEDDTVPGCSTNENGQSNSAEHQGYNVYIWTTGELAAEEPADPSAPAPEPAGDLLPYQTVEYDDVFDQVHCFEDPDSDGRNFDAQRQQCENWTGPTGTDSPGDWVMFSLRVPSDIQKFKAVLGDPQINGCYSNIWMWWGLTDDHDGSGGLGGSILYPWHYDAYSYDDWDFGGTQCASEGDWTDLWGNKVNIQEFVDQGLIALDNGAGQSCKSTSGNH